jgi:conjugal transfer/entry exclusion protein
MTNLIVSMLRLSAAMTLYSVEQMEKSLDVVEGGTELGKTIEGFEKTLNSLTDVLIREMDEKKKETLESVSKASEDMVNRSLEGMELLDPRQVMKASSDLLQKTSDVTAKWVSKAAEAVEKATEAPKAGSEAESTTVPEGEPAAAG